MTKQEQIDYLETALEIYVDLHDYIHEIPDDTPQPMGKLRIVNVGDKDEYMKYLQQEVKDAKNKVITHLLKASNESSRFIRTATPVATNRP